MLYNQVSPYFDNVLSKNQFGLRKNRVKVEGEGSWTDLSKVFNCLPHDLFIAKMQAFGFYTRTLRLIKDSLIKVIFFESYAKKIFRIVCKEVKDGIPEVSPPGPMFFNINLCDLFFIMKDVEIVNLADNNTP